MVDRSVLQGTRGDRRRCTFLERGTIVSVLYFHFMTLHSTDAKVNFPGKSTWFLTFSKNHRRESKVLLLLLLLLHSVLHFIIFSMPNRSRKPPFSMSVAGKIMYIKRSVRWLTIYRVSPDYVLIEIS